MLSGNFARHLSLRLSQTYLLSVDSARHPTVDLQVSYFPNQVHRFFFLLTNLLDTDWSTLLGCPCAVRIVYVLPSRRSLGLPPDERIKINVAQNYHALHWRPPHVNSVVFAELDSYDIHRLSVIIYRSIPPHRICYILGATDEGRRRLRRNPGIMVHTID